MWFMNNYFTKYTNKEIKTVKLHWSEVKFVVHFILSPKTCCLFFFYFFFLVIFWIGALFQNNVFDTFAYTYLHFIDIYTKCLYFNCIVLMMRMVVRSDQIHIISLLLLKNMVRFNGKLYFILTNHVNLES